jgi:hypothetical protein
MGPEEALAVVQQLRAAAELSALAGKLLGSDAVAGRFREVLAAAPRDLW